MTNNRYSLFVDMDGVLVNFIDGATTTMNSFAKKVCEEKNLYKTKYPKLYNEAKKAIAQMGGNLDAGDCGDVIKATDVQRGTDKKFVRRLMYTLISNNRNWWANLDWMPDGRELWSYVSKHKPTVLSGPQGPNSKLGKIDWCRRELGIGKDRIVLTQTKHEIIRVVTNEGKEAVLIDDLPKYVVPFRTAGGIAIQHTDATTTIKELVKLGL